MALIKCPECGSEVSDRASACPRCGCPIAQVPTKLSFIEQSNMPERPWCTVICNNNKYSCRCGESIIIKISSPSSVAIHLGAQSTSGTIIPGKEYVVHFWGVPPTFTPWLRETT